MKVPNISEDSATVVVKWQTQLTFSCEFWLSTIQWVKKIPTKLSSSIILIRKNWHNKFWLTWTNSNAHLCKLKVPRTLKLPWAFNLHSFGEEHWNLLSENLKWLMLRLAKQFLLAFWFYHCSGILVLLQHCKTSKTNLDVCFSWQFQSLWVHFSPHFKCSRRKGLFSSVNPLTVCMVFSLTTLLKMLLKSPFRSLHQ